MRQWTFMLGPGLIPRINALFLGYVMYRSRLVPRLIPAIGLVGASLILASATDTIFGAWDHSTMGAADPADRRVEFQRRRLPITIKGFRPVAATGDGGRTTGVRQLLRPGRAAASPRRPHDTVADRCSLWKSPAGRRGRRRSRDVWLRGGSRLRQIDVPTPTGGCVRSMAGVGRLGG
jgi:hypothetical protein